MNNVTPLVSIHLICFNQKDYIRETLDSILQQEYENIEIIVADDGSTDGTAEIILEYAEKNKKIVPLVGGINLGITGNSNRGLQKCNGEYVAFLGGDDLMAPNKIVHQVEFMMANPGVAVSYHNLDVFDSESGNTIRPLNKKNSYSGFCADYVKRGCVNGGSSTMIRASAIPDKGFDPVFPVASDWFFWVQAMMKSGGKIEYLDIVLGRYRRHDRNVTSQLSPFATQGLRDSIATCARIMLDYPSLAPNACYRLGVLLRAQRFSGSYFMRLLASLHVSFQIKTLFLIFLYVISFGRIKA